MKISPKLRDQLANQMTFALCPESGVSPTDAFARMILLIETCTLTADALPTGPPATWLQREPVTKVRLGRC